MHHVTEAANKTLYKHANTRYLEANVHRDAGCSPISLASTCVANDARRSGPTATPASLSQQSATDMNQSRRPMLRRIKTYLLKGVN